MRLVSLKEIILFLSKHRSTPVHNVQASLQSMFGFLPLKATLYRQDPKFSFPKCFTCQQLSLIVGYHPPITLAWVTVFTAKNSESQERSAWAQAEPARTEPLWGSDSWVRFNAKTNYFSIQVKSRDKVCSSDCTVSCLSRTRSGLTVLWQTRKS